MTRLDSRPVRSISTPIILASVAGAFSIALLVAWTIIIATYLTGGVSTWLLVIGVVSFLVILSVLVLFSVGSVREILEARRQVRFIDSVTHELKSPLASLKLCLETLDRPELSGEQRTSVQRMMADDVDRLTVFIDDILQASRLAQVRDKGVPVADVAVTDVVMDAADAVARRHKVDPSDIRVEVPDDLLLRTEETAFSTIVKNLLDNAVKYSESPIEVTVRAHVDDGRVHIEVADRGIGIPQADLRRIFRRFYRVETEAVRARRGTGLGLFVVAALVRYLGGELRAESDGLGCGTRMHLVLPLDGAS